MSAEITTCPDPEWGAEVIKAMDTAGGTILLNPSTYRAGKFAAYEDTDGRWHARFYHPAHPLRDYERRYSVHKCAKLAPVRKEQAAQAAAARNRRGTCAPKDKSPFSGAVPGGRLLPPGGAW